MAIEAPISRFKKNNLKIYIAVCLALMIWCIYDAHFNEKFIEKHTDADGNATGWLVVNKKAPPYLVGATLLMGVYLVVLGRKKIVAEDNELVISANERIPYDSIQKIDKTHFDSKGTFIFTYKDGDGNEIARKLSDRTYDNLKAILDHLVEKIS